MPSRHPVACVVVAVAVLTAAPVKAEGPAIGQFELKDLEAGADHLQFQSQNAVMWGQPRRETGVADGELLLDDNSVTKARAALEVEQGLTSHLKFRIGIEFEKERADEPSTLAAADDFDTFKLTEIGGEVIAIWIPREGDGFGWGSVVEAERPIGGGGEMNSVVYGHIFELAQGPWFAALQPMVVQHFGGEKEDGLPRDNKWDFAYAAQALYTASPAWTFGVEAYGTIDRIGSTGHRDEANATFGDHDQHRLGPIVYYTVPLFGAPGPAKAGANEADEEDEGTTATIGVGYFVGLTEDTPDGTAKLSIEVDF